MGRNRGYIFTNKQQSNIGIMSTTIGAMTIASNIYAVVKSYILKGTVPDNMGTALFVTAILATLGLVLGAISRTEKNKFYLFSYLGIAFNFIALALTSCVLYAGAYL